MFMQEDKYYEGGKAQTYNNTTVANTENDELYLNLRYGNCNYEVPMENGLYTVRLHFAELTIRDGRIGKRVFNVDIENGQERLENYDINLDVGPATAAIKTFSDIEVTDGFMSINLETVVYNALICGIEIINEIESVTSIENFPNEPEIGIYPNPSNGIFKVDYLGEDNSVIEELPIVIADITGKIVYDSILLKLTPSQVFVTIFL